MCGNEIMGTHTHLYEKILYVDFLVSFIEFCLRLSLSLCLSCWIQLDANSIVSNATVSKILPSDKILIGSSQKFMKCTQFHWIQLK